MRCCRVHDVELQHGRIEIRRGMPPAPPEGYYEMVETLFPYAKFFELGGCVMPDRGSPEDRDERRVWFCHACRDAQKAWQGGRDVEEFWLI